MGCKESKLAVATENTVAKCNNKRSNSIKINDAPVEKATDDENVEEFGNVIKNSDGGNVKENGIPDATKKEETKNIEEGKENIQGKEEKEGGKDEKNGNGESIVEGKVEGKEEEKENEEVKEVKKDEIRAIELEEVNPCDSPAHFFSPKRNHEETIESIISEGISGKSEYHSPRAKGSEREEKAEGNDAVEGKGLEGKANPESKNEESLKVDEGKEVVKTDETKASAATEEKPPAAEKENGNATSTSPNDVKAN